MNAQTAAPSPEKILQIGSAFWPSKTLLSAVESGSLQSLPRTDLWMIPRSVML